MNESLQTANLNRQLARLRTGDLAARNELVTITLGRLEALSRKMLRGQYVRLGRWVDTGDVMQTAAVRLLKALITTTPDSVLHFHRLMARHIRLELIDLARHFFGPEGLGANHDTAMGVGAGEDSAARPAIEPASPAVDPLAAVVGIELHTKVLTLPENEAAVTDLIFYQGLTQEEAAEVLGVNVRTVERRWQRARRILGELLSEIE